MVSFEGFEMQDGSPIYTQIVRHVKRGIIAGAIRSGEEMPSRRVLSALLGVNPNTIQKTYKLLEQEEIIESRAGAISYITVSAAQAERIRRELIEGDANVFVSSMKQMGISRQEALELIDKIWE